MYINGVLIYNTIWTLVTIGMSIYCIYTYLLDKDATKIEFRSYQSSEEDVYPSFSICFNKPYDPVKLSKVASKCKVSDDSLIKTISGEQSFDLNTCNFTYDEITLDLNDHVIKAKIHSYGATSLFNEDLKIYVSYRSSKGKCFTLDIPYVKEQWVSKVEVSLNFSAFALNFFDYRNFRIMSHYPNQNMASEFGSYNDLALYELKNNKTLVRKRHYRVFVAQVDAIKIRNKLRKKCNPDWRNHDQFLIREVIRAVGCQPFYLEPLEGTRICKSKNEHYAFDSMIQAIKNQTHTQIRPCKKIEKLYYDSEWTHEETDLGKITEAELAIKEIQTPFDLSIIFQGNTYKVIDHVKDFTFQTMIGNIGRYAGMFLGCSFLQIPNLVQNIIGVFTSKRQK